MVEFGIFVFNLNALEAFFAQPTWQIIGQLFSIGGYLVFVYLLLYLALNFYVEYRQNKATKDWHYVLLAVDVPPLNIQTPKGVEQMFTHLAGAYDKPDIAGKFRGGYDQRKFSFEIISIEGYIQFLIRTEAAFRELVEAAIYAQYPEAEITEVQDYVDFVPVTFPNNEYDAYAVDFGLANDNAYPIRSYKEFEHTISKDEPLKDPMSAVLESFSRIGPGEQLWMQIIIEPVGSEWKEKAIKKIKEVIGEKVDSGGGSKIADAITGASAKFLEGVGDQIFGREASESGGDEKKGPKNELQFLTPGQGKIVEAMEQKISQVGFETKIRAVYLARKEVFRTTRGVNALVGALNQFNVPTANSIVGTYSTSASYFFKKRREDARKNLLLQAYKKRKPSPGGKKFIFNPHELATVWHFPMSTVKTPLIQKVQTKQSEPPVELPMETYGAGPFSSFGMGADAVPETLPVEDSGPQVDAYGYDDTQQFG